MPVGVEHTAARTLEVRERVVVPLPLMPVGVEHGMIGDD